MAVPAEKRPGNEPAKTLTQSGNLLNCQRFCALTARASAHISPFPRRLPGVSKLHLLAVHLPTDQPVVFERQFEKSLNGPRVLIIGEARRGLFGMAQRLEQWGCRCFLVDSPEIALRLFTEQSFELVLAVGTERRIGNELINRLRGTTTSLFRAVPVEDSCWWVPMLRQGRECTGGGALRPTEFAGLVQRIVSQCNAQGNGPIEKRSASSGESRRTDKAVSPPAAEPGGRGLATYPLTVVK